MNLTETNSVGIKSFVTIVDLIKQSKQKAFVSVNRELIDLYWNIGEYISKKTESDGWGKMSAMWRNGSTACGMWMALANSWGKVA